MKKKSKPTRLGRPSAILWFFAYLVMWPIYRFKYGMRVDRSAAGGRIKGPALVIAPHTAEKDPFLIGAAIYPVRPNYVVSAHFLSIPKIRRIFRILHVIPKRMFSADPSTILNIGRAKREGNVVVIFPEGRLPCSGHSVPIAQGTDALVKKLGIDVYVVTCHGAYKSFPKWSPLARRGRILAKIEKIFTKEELPSLDIEQVKARLAAALEHNDEASLPGVNYRCRATALGADGIIYRCPECDRELTITAEGDKISCSCGHTVRLLPDYTLEGSRFATLGEWFLWQRKMLDTKAPLSAHVRVGTPDERGNMNENAGEGDVTLSEEALSFDGVVCGEPLSFVIPTDKLGGIPITVGKHFDTYYNNRLYYFYPQPDTRISVKWVTFYDKLLIERQSCVKENV